MVNDPIAAYYIRDFEVWGYRNAWEDWTRYTLDEAARGNVTVGMTASTSLDEEYGPSPLESDEIDKYCEVMGETLCMDAATTALTRDD